MIVKNVMKNFMLLLMAILLTVACGNSRVSNVENAAAEDVTDDYALLSEQENTPKKNTEDFSGRVIVIYEEDFKTRITALNNPKGFQYLGQTPCIVDLYADWCRPCTYLSHVLNELAPDYKGKVIFYKLNIDKAPEVVDAFKVTNIPKILYFKPHSEVVSTLGFLTKEELIKAIDDILLKP